MNALLALLLATVIEPRPIAPPAITPPAIKAHIDFLASDLLEGREAGTRGHEIAAAYVAAQLATAGVEPAGDGGTYLQQVRFRTFKLDADHSSFCIRPAEGPCEPFVHRKDVLIGTTTEPERELVDAEVVHAGFGIVAKDLGQDDYANVDVRGKVVAILSGAPARFPPSERAVYSDSLGKLRTAAEHGAIGILTIRTLDVERRFSWARIIAQEGGPSFRALDASGQPLEVVPAIRVGAALGTNAAEALLRDAPVKLEALLADADKSIAHSFPLGVHVSIHAATTLGEQTSPNVVGIVRGSDPRLASESVVLSAHLDHLGLASSGADRVRNGALDNASGIAALIEIARKVAALPRKPARSIVFVAVTAEEKGEQGSLAFAEKPSVAGPIVANVNMDMLTMLFPLRTLVALGVEHSSLGPLARDAAKQAGFELQDDPLPEEVRFIRSDQYSFVKKGIPAITYKGGFTSRDPKLDGETLTRDWMRTVYHSAADNPDQKLDYASGARWAEANYNLVVAIANAKERPRWNAGDIFDK
jgi:peptidase M28-like protein